MLNGSTDNSFLTKRSFLFSKMKWSSSGCRTLLTVAQSHVSEVLCCHPHAGREPPPTHTGMGHLGWGTDDTQRAHQLWFHVLMLLLEVKMPPQPSGKFAPSAHAWWFPGFVPQSPKPTPQLGGGDPAPGTHPAGSICH